MRKLFYAAAFIAITSSIFIACTKDETVSSQKETLIVSKSQSPFTSRIGQNVINLTDYGFYHNEGLSLYYTSQDGISQTNSNLIIEKVTNELQTKYPKEFSNLNLTEIKSAFSGTNPQNFDMVLFWNSKKEDLYNRNKLSRRVGGLVDKILVNNMTYDQYILEIQNFKKTNNLDLNEQNSLIVFESVLQSSNEYWSSDNNSTNKAKPGSKAILADGMGALMFCYSGPGSIIAGCICSLFVNESQEP